MEEYRLLATYKNIIKFEFEPALYKLILEYLKKNEETHDVPLISIYYNTLLLILDRNETNFEKLKRKTINELNTLSFSDKYSTLAVLLNFANDEYLKGDKKYLKEAFELYKIILENKLYAAIEGEPFYNPLFRNIVKVGLLMKEIEWTENFIKSYISKLIPEARESSLYLSNARVNFVKGNYDKSLEELSKIVSIHHFQVKPSIKSLSLMIYIEKGWFDQAVDLIDAYRHYISYEKLLTDVSKEKSMNFIKFCNELIKLNSKSSREKINDLNFDLKNTENILEKEWLTGKFYEIEKRK